VEDGWGDEDLQNPNFGPAALGDASASTSSMASSGLSCIVGGP